MHPRADASVRFTVEALEQLFKEIHMPVIAWLLGVPLTVVILLMLFGVF